MYYEEKIINDVLHYRTLPKGEWLMCNAAHITARMREEQGTRKRCSAHPDEAVALLRKSKPELTNYFKAMESEGFDCDGLQNLLYDIDTYLKTLDAESEGGDE